VIACFAFRTPENRAEKGEAAEVDAADVADFVKPSRIVRRINRHILADDKARQRNRHQCAVQHSVAKAGGSVFWISPWRRPAIKPAEQKSDSGERHNFAKNSFQSAENVFAVAVCARTISRRSVLYCANCQRNQRQVSGSGRILLAAFL